MAEWIDAEQAMATLGVRAQTLYAYVSRGRVGAAAHPDDPRRSLYRASDVAALAAKKARGRRAADVAAEAIAWGEPVLPSAITTVEGGRLFYRGQDAVDLARMHSLEQVARLLRGGHGAPLTGPEPEEAQEGRDAARPAVLDPGRPGRDRPAGPGPRAAGPGDGGRRPAGSRRRRRGRVDRRGPDPPAPGRRLEPGRPGADLVRRALVLLADHELNASTFAVRVAASTGSSLAAASLAGLAALSGPLHGGMAARVEMFVDEAERRGPAKAVAERLAQGSAMPGFGHPLYPDGDPRAAALLDAFKVPPMLAELRRETEGSTGLPPNIDFALVAMARTLALPADAPFSLFAVGRMAGWHAHAIEQLQTGKLIRPRARYVGEAPPT
jgi:citrate synthase